MKKFFVTAACLCMLAIPVYGANVDAASVPWDQDIELAGTISIGQTVTIPKREYHVVYDEDGNWEDEYYTGGEAYYQLNVTAGQTYYIDAKECYVSFLDDKGRTGGYDDDYYESYSQNYYAVKNETIYIHLYNRYSSENEQATVKAGQTFTGNVTKADGSGDNVYYYTPSLSGQYTFKISSSDESVDPGLDIGVMKRNYMERLKSKDCTWVSGYGYQQVTVNLQAGKCYVIDASVRKDESYTLALTQKPSVPVSGVTAKKAVSKKAKKAIVKWKKVSGVNGYEVTYSLKKNFKKAKTVNVSAKKAKVTLKKLKKGKKYFVKIRAYKNVEGTRYYGAYSKTLKVNVK